MVAVPSFGLWALVAAMAPSSSCGVIRRSPKVVEPEGEEGDRALFVRSKSDESLSLYHTTDEIFAEIESLKNNCSVPLMTEWVKDEGSDHGLFVVQLGDPSIKKTVMVAANEHARELITGEVSLRFIKKACGMTTSVGAANREELTQVGHIYLQVENQHEVIQERDEVLKNVRYVVLPIINVAGRKLVEQGKQTCQRMTTLEEGDVDLNRNADVDWGKGIQQKWGTAPFSTYQARVMRSVAGRHKPLAYVDLHSGARTMMTSWGFKHEVNPDYADQEKVLKAIQVRHCEDCKLGANSVTIGYDNPGEMIDHMYAKQGIKYTCLWELWRGEPGGHEPCIGYFNPYDGEYEKQVENWSDALLTFGAYMHTNVDASERSNPGLVASLAEDSYTHAARKAAEAKTLIALQEINHLTT